METCSLNAAFVFATVRNRSQLCEGPMAVPIGSAAKAVIFGGQAQDFCKVFNRFLICRGRRSTLDLWCCVFLRIALSGLRQVSSSGDNVQIVWQAWDIARVSFFVASAVGHSIVDNSHTTRYPHSSLFTLHSTLHTLDFTLHTLHLALHRLHFTLHTLHSSLYTTHFTLYTSHSTLGTPQATLCTPHSSLLTLHYTLYSTLYTQHCTLYTWHFTLYTWHSTLYTLDFTLHATLCTPHSSPFTLHYTLYSTIHTLHFTVHTLHFALHTLHSLLYLTHLTLCTPHYTLYTLHMTLHTLHFTFYTLHTTLCTPHSSLFTLHSSLYTAHYTLFSTLHTLHFTLYTPNSTLYTPHSSLFTLHYTLYSTLHTLHCTLHTLHFTLCTSHYTWHSTLYTWHSTLYSLHFTLHTLHFALHSFHFTLRTPHSTLCTPHFSLYTSHSTLDTSHSTILTLYPTCFIPHSTLHCLHTPHSALHPIPHSTVYTGRVRGEECTRLLKSLVSRECFTWLVALVFVPSSALQSMRIFFSTRRKMSLMKCHVLPKHVKTIASIKANYMLRTRSNPRPPQVSGRFSAACNPKSEIQDCRQRHEIWKKMQEIHSTLYFLIPFQANWVYGNCGRLKRVSGEKQLGQAKKGRVSLCPWSSGVDEFRSDKLHFVLWKIQKRKSGKLHWLFKLEKWKIKRSKRVGNAAASSKELKSWYKIEESARIKEKAENQKNACLTVQFPTLI